jgi:hypothetical protein
VFKDMKLWKEIRFQVLREGAEDEDDAEDQALGLEPQVDEFVDEEPLRSR